MPVLQNSRHERFAQEVAKGKSATEAYKDAGYTPKGKVAASAASRLLRGVKVKARIDELLQNAADKAGLTVERVLSELSKIAFADIRQAVRWGRGPIDSKSKHGNSNGLELVPSDEISDDIAAAVSEVALTPSGVRIKLHDKKSALVDLGKHLGMFKERVEHTGKDGAPIETVTLSDTDAARRLAFILARAAQAK